MLRGMARSDYEYSVGVVESIIDWSCGYILFVLKERINPVITAAKLIFNRSDWNHQRIASMSVRENLPC